MYCMFSICFFLNIFVLFRKINPEVLQVRQADILYDEAQREVEKFGNSARGWDVRPSESSFNSFH